MWHSKWYVLAWWLEYYFFLVQDTPNQEKVLLNNQCASQLGALPNHNSILFHHIGRWGKRGKILQTNLHQHQCITGVYGIVMSFPFICNIVTVEEWWNSRLCEVAYPCRFPLRYHRSRSIQSSLWQSWWWVNSTYTCQVWKQATRLKANGKFG